MLFFFIFISWIKSNVFSDNILRISDVSLDSIAYLSISWPSDAQKSSVADWSLFSKDSSLFNISSSRFIFFFLFPSFLNLSLNLYKYYKYDMNLET